MGPRKGGKQALAWRSCIILARLFTSHLNEISEFHFRPQSRKLHLSSSTAAPIESLLLFNMQIVVLHVKKMSGTLIVFRK
mmetsp:Transcript_17383/g.47978  ORF Transcript_17383/g.47978 Transcript_17383/m.47978 type:complete len:80 (+) Transcript_17383:330-569(+)